MTRRAKAGLADVMAGPGREHLLGLVATYVLVDSVALREELSEDSYLEALGEFHSTVLAGVELMGSTRRPPSVYGDEVVCVYPTKSRLSAYVDAQRVQEATRDEVEGSPLAGIGIGIARGRVVEFAGPDGRANFAGEAVDRSAALAARCRPRQILVDAKAADLAEGDSESIGESVAMAFGGNTRVRVRGFKQSLLVREFHWGLHPDDLAADRRQIKAGKIATWDPAKGRGLIVTDSGERYYTDRRHTAGLQHPRRAARVFFSDEEPRTAGGNRLAAAVVAMGDRIEGRVTEVNTDYAKLETHDKAGSALPLITAIGEDVAGLEHGTIVRFTVTENVQGPAAQELEAVGVGVPGITSRTVPAESRFVLAVLEQLRTTGATGAAAALTKSLSLDLFQDRSSSMKDLNDMLSLANYAIENWGVRGLHAIEEGQMADLVEDWIPIRRPPDAGAVAQIVGSWRQTLRGRRTPSPDRLPVKRDSVLAVLTEIQLALRHITDAGDPGLSESDARWATSRAADRLGAALALAFRGGIVTSLPPETKRALLTMRPSHQ